MSEQDYPNEAKYKEIYAKKQAHPELPLSKLCADVGTSYQSYNNWYKKNHRKGIPAAATMRMSSGTTLRVSVGISVAELVKALTKKTTSIMVSIKTIIASLAAPEREALYRALGQHTMNQLHGRSEEDGQDNHEASL